MKCIFCNVYKDRSYDDTELVGDGALKLLENLKKTGILFLNITGGEPLLKRDLVEILRHARKMGFFITMNDNGLLLKQYAPLIKDYVDSIHVSLDSHMPQNFEMIRGVEGAFSKVIEGIQAAKGQGMHVSVNLTVNKHNIDEIGDFCAFMQNFDVDVFLTIVCFIPTEFHDTSQSKYIKVSSREYAQKVKALKKNYPFIKTSDSYLNFVEHGGFNNYRCLAMKTTINVKPDGSIAFPCGYFPKFKFNGDLDKIRQWQHFKDATKVVKYDFCKDCMLSCFFAPTALMDIHCWGPLLKSYCFPAVNNKKQPSKTSLAPGSPEPTQIRVGGHGR